jgi:hypothetical protein
MFYMLIGLQSVTMVWFCLQADWKPARPWERAGWFLSFSDELRTSASSGFRSKQAGSRFDESPDASIRRPALDFRP